MAVLSALVLLLSARSGSGLEAPIGERCEVDTSTFLRELDMQTPQEYSLRMYDAFGRQGSNVESGNVDRAGSYSQCLSVHGPTFNGQYCQAFFQQGSIRYQVGICVPDSCSTADVKLLVSEERLQFGQTSLIPPISSILINASSQTLLEVLCRPNTISPSTFEIVCLVLSCIMIAIPLVATLITAIIAWRRSREVDPSAEPVTTVNSYGSLKDNGPADGPAEVKDSSGCRSLAQTCMKRYLEAFSLQNTCQGVLNTTPSVPGGFPCLNGIRVLSLLWIINGHVGILTIDLSGDNPKTWMAAMRSSPLYSVALSGPIFLGVDSFLLLGGLLSARSLLKAMSRTEDKLHASLVAKFIFNRIKRVQPLNLFIMFFANGLYSLLLWGSSFFSVKPQLGNCEETWWTQLLLIMSLVPYANCIPWSWYLSLDMHCFCTTPLVIYCYKKNKGLFAAVAGVLLLVPIVTGAVLTAVHQLMVFMPLSMFLQGILKEYMTLYYGPIYTRYGPYFIGILAGIYLVSKTDRMIKHKWQAALGWFCSLLLLALVIGLAYVLKDAPAALSVPHSLYQGLHRTLWAVALAWIIVACEEGYGGFINSFLSSRFWVPLANISFSMYMTHVIFIDLYNGFQENTVHYSDWNFMFIFFGVVVLSAVTSYLVTVLIEKPYALNYKS